MDVEDGEAGCSDAPRGLQDGIDAAIAEGLTLDRRGRTPPRAGEGAEAHGHEEEIDEGDVSLRRDANLKTGRQVTCATRIPTG